METESLTVLEIGNRGEHDTAEVVHLGVEILRPLLRQIVTGYVVGQDVLGYEERQIVA